MTLKIAVLAPMPRARVTSTARLNAGERASARKARRRSWATSCMRIRRVLRKGCEQPACPGEPALPCGERPVGGRRRPETGLGVPHPASAASPRCPMSGAEDASQAAMQVEQRVLVLQKKGDGLRVVPLPELAVERRQALLEIVGALG